MARLRQLEEARWDAAIRFDPGSMDAVLASGSVQFLLERGADPSSRTDVDDYATPWKRPSPPAVLITGDVAADPGIVIRRR